MIFRQIRTSCRSSPGRIRKVNNHLARELDFRDIKFSFKIRNIHKIERKNCIDISAFHYENKEKYPMYVARNTFKRYVDLLLISEECKRHYVIIKDFSTFLYHHTLHLGKKNFCRYCLQAFSTKEILKCHIIWMIDLKVVVNKGLRCLKKVNNSDSKTVKGK